MRIDVRAIKVIERVGPVRIEPSREGVVRRQNGEGIEKPHAVVIDPDDQKKPRVKSKAGKVNGGDHHERAPAAARPKGRRHGNAETDFGPKGGEAGGSSMPIRRLRRA